MSKVTCKFTFRQRWKLSRRWRRCETRRRIHATGKRHCPPLALPRNVSTPAAPLLPGLPQVVSPLPAAYVDGCVFVWRRLAGAHGRKAELAARRATAFRRLRARTARLQVSVRLEVSSPNRAQPWRCAPSVCCAATSTFCRLRPAHMLLRRWLQEAGTRKFRSKIKSGRKTGFSGALAAPID